MKGRQVQLVEPKVFLIGETSLVPGGLEAYLKHLETQWKFPDDANSASEIIPEVMGRICYRSWEPGMNPNVTKVRQGNQKYLDNIKVQKHGSVMEHVNFNFIFADVSRVFTHELITHRVGTAKSQESLRYVRLDKMSAYFPMVFEGDDGAKALFENTMNDLEIVQKFLGQYFKLSEESDFGKKKRITSAMRRLAPEGVATTVGWSANARTLYNVIQRRTSPHAEEEIRRVFGRVAEIVRQRYPNLFGDLVPQEAGSEKGVYWYASPNGEI
jgi:thymidylate synthase (FAD)